jgi:hypothetical protein
MAGRVSTYSIAKELGCNTHHEVLRRGWCLKYIQFMDLDAFDVSNEIKLI